MTEKLYRADSHLWHFTAAVKECRKDTEESGCAIVLDKTAFYPGGGGQPCDTGTLGGVRVMKAYESPDGVIYHHTDTPLPVGVEIEGQVDGGRRTDYMVQHTADHILSGLFHTYFGLDNVGFHMGRDTTEIDFNGVVDQQGRERVERLANEVVQANVPVVSYTVKDGEEEAYRSKRAIEGDVRVVRVEGVDSCACCGVHVKRTGEIGCIKIVSVSKVRGGMRISYVAGMRAFDYLHQIQLQNHHVSVRLSAQPLQTDAALERLTKEYDALKERWSCAERMERERVAALFCHCHDVLLFGGKLTGTALHDYALAISKQCDGTVVIFSGDDTSGYQYAAACTDHEVRTLSQEMNDQLEGRGGGKEDVFMQGHVRAARAHIDAFFRQLHRIKDRTYTFSTFQNLEDLARLAPPPL